MKGAMKFMKETYREKTTACCIFVSAIVLLIDYMTGRNIQFPVFYLIPPVMAAWMNRKKLAYLSAVFLALARIGFHFAWNTTEFLHFAILNGIIRAVALSFYVYLVDLVASQTKELQKKVKILEGILPICSSCKRIRNPEGEFEPIEKYITEHSEAFFSHGICPDCGKKLYPEYFNDKNV